MQQLRTVADQDRSVNGKATTFFHPAADTSQLIQAFGKIGLAFDDNRVGKQVYKEVATELANKIIDKITLDCL